MESLPVYISIVFILTTFLTIYLLYKAAYNSLNTLLILIAWLILQTIISRTGFYQNTLSIPPRFILLVLPPILFILVLFVTKRGQRFIDNLKEDILTLLHIVRIPVEIVLLWLFLNKTVPQLMTFEGRNFDILSGLSAPLIYYFGYKKNRLNNTILLAWNFICLGLLLNIVINAVLSTPFAFQQFAFDQPNIAVLYFPFVWLPCCIVPIVLFSHLVLIRQLLNSKKFA